MAGFGVSTEVIRGSRAYEDEFARDPKSYGEQHLANLVSADELEQFLKERTRIAPSQPKQDPNDMEYGLLYSAFAHHQGSSVEDMVCETKEWVEGVRQDRVAKQLALFAQPCLEALSREAGLHFLPVPGKPGWGAWALRAQGRLLLIVPATDTTAIEAERFAKETARVLAGQDATTILRASRRAYPALILADDELWIDLENEQVANMALSPEESEVLESARGSSDPFPLFINGRAGSGKSTILQYLFADLLFYYLKAEAGTMAPPIYLTANGELLRVARTFIERLLRSEATFTQHGGADLVEENSQILDDAFREFQPHLLSLVPAGDRAVRFSRPGRVDYATFRRMWMDRFGKDQRALREFGPDLSWHVIRSYIKGMSSETYLEPDDYAQLPENQITVTRGAFRQVFDRVWTAWYQVVLEDDGLWDDQDLTRYVLDNDLAKRVYPAVFCDEAQDFTRIELELLLRLNLFSDRTLRSTDISRVPFAFAGDQFQTLNPTGFRWDSIKASFVEKFIFELDPSRRSGRTDLNYRELKYNYRSTHKIVRFCNHVQALRAGLFQLPDLRPQTPWTNEPRSFPVVWFRANDAAFWKAFRQHGGFVVIVPCNEGEEREFVEKDPHLREHILIEDGVPVNVLSAGRAKGREYPAVLVYGFGTAAETDIMAELTSGNRAGDPDKSLPIQYFINRLYVATSRPKNRLVVVDGDSGFARLWRCAQEEGAESDLLDRIKNGRQIWAPEIEGMTVGKPDELTRENTADPLENARAFEADGLARQDPFLLKQAAQAYRSGGDVAKAKECRARALEAEGNLFDAGDGYFEAGFAVPDGVRCLWRSGRKGWERLCEHVGANAHIQRETEFQWAKGITQKSRPEEVIDLLVRFDRRLEESSYADTCIGDPLWRDAVSGLLLPLLHKDRPAISDDHLQQLVVVLDNIHARGIKLSPGAYAKILYQAHRFPDAIRLWDEMEEAKPPEYMKAKASVEPYPQRLVTLSKLGLNDAVLSAYSAEPSVALSPEQGTAVVDALREARSFDDAFQLAWGSGLAAPMLRLSASAFRADADRLASASLHASVLLLVKQAQWETLASFATSLEFFPSAEWKDEKIREWVESQAEALHLTLVRALGRSKELPDAPSHLQRQFSDFLRRFVRTKAVWGSRLTVTEVGAAVERAGRFTDAASFYDALRKGDGSLAEKRFAQERWLVCKQRQVDHERSQGGGPKINAIQEEIRQVQKSLQLKNVGGLGRFPDLAELGLPSGIEGAVGDPSSTPVVQPAPTELSPLPSPAGLQDHVAMQIGSFKIELSRKNSRCNITHLESMETAYLRITEKTCGGEVAFVAIDRLRWTCAAWKLTVSFPDLPADRLVLSLQELGVQVRLQVSQALNS